MDGRGRAQDKYLTQIGFGRGVDGLFREIGNSEELTDKTVVYLAVGGQVPLMRQMVSTKLAGVKGRFFGLVMMERQHQCHRQHYRQQQYRNGGAYLFHSLHRPTKIQIKKENLYKFSSYIRQFNLAMISSSICINSGAVSGVTLRHITASPTVKGTSASFFCSSLPFRVRETII